MASAVFLPVGADFEVKASAVPKEWSRRFGVLRILACGGRAWRKEADAAVHGREPALLASVLHAASP